MVHHAQLMTTFQILHSRATQWQKFLLEGVTKDRPTAEVMGNFLWPGYILTGYMTDMHSIGVNVILSTSVAKENINLCEKKLQF